MSATGAVESEEKKQGEGLQCEGGEKKVVFSMYAKHSVMSSSALEKVLWMYADAMMMMMIG